MKLHENGNLCGWWVRIWTRAGREPFCAEECLDLSHNLMLYCMQQSLTSDSLISRKSRKVQPNVRCTAILPTNFSPLSRRAKTYMLQIVLIYRDMKLMNTLCYSHFFCYQCLPGKASPMRDNFSPKFSLIDDSARKTCVYFVAYCLYLDYRT